MIAKELMTTDYIKIDKNEPISKLIGEMIRTKQRAAVVFDKKKYIGITTKTLLVKTKFDPTKLKIAKIIEKVPVLNGKEDIVEVARLLYTAKAPILPVIEKSVVIGIVKGTDIINNLPSEDKKRKVKDIMTLEPITIHENDRLGKAIEIMYEKKISRIPLIDDQGKIVSISSLTDILEKYQLFLQGKGERGSKMSMKGITTGAKDAEGRTIDLDSYPIKNLTSPIIITGTEDDTVSDVLDKMNEYDISSLVIVRDQKPVGIVSVRDLLKLFIKERITF